MRRRDFIAGAAGLGAAWPLAARAQQPERVRRIAVLMGYAETDLAAQAQVAAFRQELQKLGWDEGRNIHIDVRFPAANADNKKILVALSETIRLMKEIDEVVDAHGGWPDAFLRASASNDEMPASAEISI